MLDFFDKSFTQSLIASLIVIPISIWLGGRALPSSGKGWKVMVIISYLLIFGGSYMIMSNVSNGGLNNLFVGIGITSAIFGFLLRCLGKFFIWWQH